MKFKGKVVVVTGASSGIGLACAKEFGKNGAKVVMAARNNDKLNAAAETLENQGVEVLAVQTDVSKKEDCKRRTLT